jgi:hypothetical protein
MEATKIVSGKFEFREHVVDGVAKYSAHTGEAVEDLAGRLVADGIEDLREVEGGLHGLSRKDQPEKKLFGSGPTSGRVAVGWVVDQKVFDEYVRWCDANQAAHLGVMSGIFLHNFANEVLSIEGLAEQLKFKTYSWNQWRMESDIAYLATHGTLASLRSQEAMWSSGGGCLDRDPNW